MTEQRACASGAPQRRLAENERVPAGFALRGRLSLSHSHGHELPDDKTCQLGDELIQATDAPITTHYYDMLTEPRDGRTTCISLPGYSHGLLSSFCG